MAFDYAIEQEKIKREKASAELAKITKATEVEKVSIDDLLVKSVEDSEAKESTETKTTVDKTKPKAEPKKAKKPLRERTEYVSKFETLAEGGKVIDRKDKALIKRRKDAEAEERKFKSIEIRKEKDYDIKPEYSPEELAEIEATQEELESTWVNDDIDFDEFDEYYE